MTAPYTRGNLGLNAETLVPLNQESRQVSRSWAEYHGREIKLYVLHQAGLQIGP